MADKTHSTDTSITDYTQDSIDISNADRSMTITQDLKDFTESDLDDLTKIPKIVDIIDSPPWLIYNDFINYGYRINYRSHADFIKSVFSLHNETTNIWTHMIGAFIFIYILFNTAAFFDPLWLTFQKFIEEVKKTKWSSFDQGLQYQGISKMVKEIERENYLSFYENMLKVWDEFSVIIKVGWVGKDGGRFKEIILTILKGYPTIFPLNLQVNQTDGKAMSQFFKAVRIS